VRGETRFHGGGEAKLCREKIDDDSGVAADLQLPRAGLQTIWWAALAGLESVIGYVGRRRRQSVSRRDGGGEIVWT